MSGASCSGTPRSGITFPGRIACGDSDPADHLGRRVLQSTGDARAFGDTPGSGPTCPSFPRALLVHEALEHWRPRLLELSHAGQQELAVLAGLPEPGDHPAVADDQRRDAPHATAPRQPVLLADQPSGLRGAETGREAIHLEPGTLGELEDDVRPGHVEALLQRRVAEAGLELQAGRLTLQPRRLQRGERLHARPRRIARGPEIGSQRQRLALPGRRSEILRRSGDLVLARKRLHRAQWIRTRDEAQDAGQLALTLRESQLGEPRPGAEHVLVNQHLTCLLYTSPSPRDS